MDSSLVVTGVSAVFVALNTAIVYLYKTSTKRSVDHQADMRKRDDDRRKETTSLNHKLGLLEGEHRGIKQLSEETLDVVHRAMQRGRDQD